MLRYLVLGSRVPGVFSLGGDLHFFAPDPRAGPRGARRLRLSCVRILHRNLLAALPVVTIGLVQGDALGGGFESLLSFDVIVAEKGAKFGLPENLFGLFPGMGAYSLLGASSGRPGRGHDPAGEISPRRRCTIAGSCTSGRARRGRRAVQEYIARNSRRHSAQRAVYEGSAWSIRSRSRNSSGSSTLGRCGAPPARPGSQSWSASRGAGPPPRPALSAE